MKQRLVSMVALIALVLSIGITVSATEVSPRWDTGNRCTAVLTFSGTTANCVAKITAADSTAKINAGMTLYRINANGSQSHVASWSGLTGTGRLDATRSYSPVVSGAKYKLVISGTIAGEVFSTYDSETCP